MLWRLVWWTITVAAVMATTVVHANDRQGPIERLPSGAVDFRREKHPTLNHMMAEERSDQSRLSPQVKFRWIAQGVAGLTTMILLTIPLLSRTRHGHTHTWDLGQRP